MAREVLLHVREMALRSAQLDLDGLRMHYVDEGAGPPVLLLHGEQDRFVPFGHGVWLAAHIPGVEARLTKDDGHLTLTTRHLGEVYDWLLEHW